MLAKSVAQVGLPVGGVGGDFLRKRSAVVFDVEWSRGVTSFFTHNQTTESAEWVINHNLGRYPVIVVLSVGLMQVLAEVVHIDMNQARVRFSQPYRGLAQCV